MTDTRPDAAAAASLPPVAARKPVNAPRRCFICLTDESPSDSPSSWVDPCPCTLEAHQDCMLSWVTDCERSNKPLLCPVCKSPIELEGPWDPIVALSEALHSRFTRASPYMLFTGASLGVQFSAQLYGAVAMWVFAGREPLREYILGPRLLLDHPAPFRSKLARVGNVTMLMNVAPVLLFSHMLPSLSNKIFVTTASVYGMYHLMHDENFLLLPPSPQLAFAIFPGIRSLYYNLYREFVWPYEVNLNRQIIGLPPVEARQNGNPDRENRRNADRNGEGVIGFLQNVLDALEPEDEEQGGADAGQRLAQGEVAVEGADANVEAELVLEVVIDQGDADDGQAGADDVDQGPQVNGQPAVAGQEAEGDRDREEHEAPQAPPVRRAGIGAILSNVSNSIVSALILPAISAAVGETLRLVLPKSWTVTTGDLRRPGLLRQQWGRSLIGGCLFVVIKDAVRIYTKSRKVAAMSNRRVKNVDRRRGSP